MTWCIDQTAGRVDVTSRVAHAFPERPDGTLSTRALCGVECAFRQDVWHTRYVYTRCAVCEGRAGA